MFLGVVFGVMAGLMGGLVIDRFQSLSGYTTIMNNDKAGSKIDPECEKINIVVNDSLTEPYSLNGRKLIINTKLSSNLSMPEKYRKMYNLSQPPEDYPYSNKKENIVIIGDSFSTASGVSIDQTFPYILNARSNYNIINLGIGGYNTKQEVQRLKEVGLTYNPKYVILQFYDNDWEDGAVEWSIIRNISFYFEEKNLTCFSDPLTPENNLFKNLYLLIYERILSKNISGSIENNIVSPIKQLNDLSIRYNFTVIILKLPSNKKLVVEKIFRNNVKDYKWEIIELENEMDFPGWKPPFTLSPYDSHFSPKTHRGVAQVLMKHLK